MKSIINGSKKIISMLLTLVFLLSAFSTSYEVNVSAEPDYSTLSIEVFKAYLAYGASKVGDRYIWTPESTDSDHPFVYRIDYGFSGEGMIPEKSILVTMPKSILHNRSGNPSDICELSVPHIDQADSSTDWAYYSEGNNYVITNLTEVDPAMSGYFEVAYRTKQQTYEYADSDYNAHDIPVFNITLKREGERDLTETASGPRVMIDTSAEIVSTTKTVNYYKRLLEWNTGWGPRPDDADEYYYMVWSIYTTFSDCTQYFNFTLDDVMDMPDSDVVGYRMSGQSQYSTNNTAYNQLPNKKIDSNDITLLYRYDYVLTRHKRSAYPYTAAFNIKNKIVATVTPSDGADSPTSETASQTFYYDPPKYRPPTGHFWQEKEGARKYNFSLDDLRDKTVAYAHNNLYFKTYLYGYPYPWTLADGHANTEIDQFGKKKVKWVLTDDKFTFFGNTERLTADDYEIKSIDLVLRFNDARFDTDVMRFVSTDAVIGDDEYLQFEAKFGNSNTFVNVGKYYFNSGRTELESAYADKVISFTDEKVELTDNAQCTGFRFTTENAHYYFYICAFPNCRLKSSDYIISKTGNANKVYLENYSKGEVFSGDSLVFFDDYTARDYIVGDQRHGHLVKSCTSTQNNKLKKYIANNWHISLWDELEDNDGVSKVEQESGKFYDLLPLGCEIQNSSIRVASNNVTLSESSYDVSFIQNYKNSGQTMMIVDVKEKGKIYDVYYTTTYSWDNLKDYGSSLLNTVAYETGNEKIGDGLPDNGGSLTYSHLMNDLDPDTNAKRFIYQQRIKVIDYALTTASTGLTKRIVSLKGDAIYSSDVIVSKNSTYAYKLRLAANISSKAKNIFIYDSLENYSPRGKTSDWKGILTGVDITQPKRVGIEPKVYYSVTPDLDISKDNNKNCCLTERKENGSNIIEFSEYNSDNIRIWYTEEELIQSFGTLSAAKAICIDLSTDRNGDPFVLEPDRSLNVILNMTSPMTVDSNESDPCNYNSVRIFNTVFSDIGEEENHYIQYNYTKAHYRMVADVGIYKADSTDLSKPIKDIYFVIEGTSDYGSDVYSMLPTDSNGHILFKDIEKGTYKLYETDGSQDYHMLKDNMQVVIDGQGKVSINGASMQDDVSLTPAEGKFTGGYYTIPNEPRVHTDIEFTKRNSTSDALTVGGAGFRLTGISDYGNVVRETRVSDSAGKVLFENIEPGTYKLIEYNIPEGFIPYDIDYTVIVDMNAAYSIDGAVQAADGSYSIYNEPFHSFTIQKIDYNSEAALSGATFSLTGTSDRGTVVNEQKTTGSTGRIRFENLEKGTYILQETHQPDGYFPDDTNRIVTVRENGEITIDGMRKNESGNFVAKNKMNGTVTVVKKWNDDKENEDRPTPVVTISNKRGRTRSTATFLGRLMRNESNYRSSLERVDYASAIWSFKPWLEDKLPEDVNLIRMDDEKTDSKIYCWISSNTLYWWSDAQVVYFPYNSNYFFGGLEHMTQADLSGISTSKTKYMASMFYGCKKLQSLDLGNWDTSNVTSMESMFNGCSGMTTINLSGWNTSKVTTMSNMFTSCGSLTSLDLSSFDTSEVTDMSYMFNNCNQLTKLDVSSFTTSKVTNMSDMFYNCAKVKVIDVSGFDTSNVTEFHGMFNQCKSVEKLEVSHWNTSKITSFSILFRYCTSLKEIDVSNWDTSGVTNMLAVFMNCTSLPVLDLSRWDTSKVTTMASMFLECESLTDLNVRGFDTSNVTTMEKMFDKCTSLKILDLSSFKTASVSNMNSMFYTCSELQTIYVTNFSTTSVTNDTTRYMFYKCSSIVGGNGTTLSEDYNFNLWNKTKAVIDTPETPGYFTLGTPVETTPVEPTEPEDAVYLVKYVMTGRMNASVRRFTRFSGDAEAVSQISNTYRADDYKTNKKAYIWYNSSDYTIYWWSDAAKVYLPEDFSKFFVNKRYLSEVDFTGLDSSRVKSLSRVFYDCSSLTSVNFSGWDVSNVTTTSEMFRGCKRLTSIDLSSWSRSSITQMERMFYDCTLLENLSINNLDTSKVTSMNEVFYNCSALKDIDLSRWDTSHVTTMESMFYKCIALTNPDIRNFDTSYVRTMKNMFYQCSSLSTLDLTGWDTSYLQNTVYTFYMCKNLKTIYVDEKWTLNYIYPHTYLQDSMFTGCTALVGGKGTTFINSNYIYGRIDEPEKNRPGYLTYNGQAQEDTTEEICYISDVSQAKGVIMGDGTIPDEVSCVIDKNAAANTWTYTFSGINNTIDYYVWEDMLDGYRSNAYEQTPGIIQNGSFTIINTAPTAPEYGSLKISKQLTAASGADPINAEDLSQTFVFTVT